MTHPSSPESTVQPFPREDPASPFESETSHSSSPQTIVQQLPVLEHPGSSSQSELSHISSPHATLQQPFLSEMTHPSSPESTVQPLPREDPASPFESETSHSSSPQATVQQLPVLEHPGSPSQSELSHVSSPQATLQQPFLSEMTHPSSPESTVQPLPGEDPASPFESETSHSSSPQATVQQLPVLEHPGSSSQSESSDISSPQATLQQPAPHPSSPESTVQPLPREDPVSPFESETSHSSSPQATVQQLPVLEHPGSSSQSESSDMSSPQATLQQPAPHPSSPESTVQPLPREDPVSPFHSETSLLSSPQATLQQPAPPPLFMHLTLLKLWLRRWWIICMIAAIGFLFLISWSIHTSQKNDANIWCTTPNATVTKESNAPSSTEIQGAPILFRTIMAAVDAAPGDNEWPFCILIQKGVYKERIVIERNKRNLVLVGEGINKTIISSNGAVMSTDRYISELATIWVLGKRFKAMDISFENIGADQLESVALKNSGDESIFHRCSFMSQVVSIHSDHVGQQLYHDCYISGSQHLIYGDGHAMFQRSTIHVNNLKPEVGAVIALQERRTYWSSQNPFEPSLVGFTFDEEITKKFALDEKILTLTKMFVATEYICSVEMEKGRVWEGSGIVVKETFAARQGFGHKAAEEGMGLYYLLSVPHGSIGEHYAVIPQACLRTRRALQFCDPWPGEIGTVIHM
ncbi:putative pectinesterase/pectinesterase inhibitor 25 [Vitis vinifera]|uniref:pectinesterase n=1 Tax=Vitis vinifera TaxID=29760 RepID=A0A438C4N3_VITVI|nr:putative pectinesterase/pectinesterase inhibitor 25 [Vitis vinifera]